MPGTERTEIEAEAPKRFTPSFQVWVGLSALCYAIIAFFYGVSPWASSPVLREIFLWPILAALAFFYWKAYKALAQAPSADSTRSISKSSTSEADSPFSFALTRPVRAVAIAVALLGTLAILIPPFHSTDVFGYINRGWQQAHYGLNPYVFTVDQTPGWRHDPMLTNHWVNNPSPYGFLYLLIAKGLCLLGGGNKTATLALFKLFNLGVYFATGALLFFTARQLQQRGISPLRPEIALFLFLANPLILLHGLANGHNDCWLGFFLLLSGCLAILGSWLWVLPALVTSALIKYASVVLGPFALLLFIKNKAWKTLVGGLILSLALILLTGIPYLPDWSHFHLKEISRNAAVSHGSLHSFVYSLWKLLAPAVTLGWVAFKEPVRQLLANALMGGFAGFYMLLFFRRLRQPVYLAADWVKDALLVMVALITLASLKFYPWYLAMFFPLAFLLKEGDWLRRFLIGLSGAQLLSFTMVGQAHLLNFFLMTACPWLGVALPQLGLSRKHIALVFVLLLVLLLGLAFVPLMGLIGLPHAA